MEHEEVEKFTEEIRTYAKPKGYSFITSIDDELYLLNEVIRVYFSNELTVPNNTDIYRKLLEEKVQELRAADPEKVDTIIDFIAAMGETPIDTKQLKSKVFVERNKA